MFKVARARAPPGLAGGRGQAGIVRMLCPGRYEACLEAYPLRQAVLFREKGPKSFCQFRPRGASDFFYRGSVDLVDRGVQSRIELRFGHLEP